MLRPRACSVFPYAFLNTDQKGKQGRIYGYPSRVRAGRGRILGHSIIWARAVRPKTAKTQKKVKCDGQINGPTDRQSGV